MDSAMGHPRNSHSATTSSSRPKVFISHATADRDLVQRHILDLLRAHGIDTWYAEDDIHTAEEWEMSIRQGLASCEWFLVVMTPRSANSKWVQAEVNWAIDKRQGRLIPVLLEACDLNNW